MIERDFHSSRIQEGSDPKTRPADLTTFEFGLFIQAGQASSPGAMAHLPEFSLVGFPNDQILQRAGSLDERVFNDGEGGKQGASDKRPSVTEDLQTLTDADATVAALDRAGLRLIERAAEPLSYRSENARSAILGLRKVVDSNSNSRRAKRESQGLLVDIFDRLSDGGKGLANAEARERIARMGPTAMNPLSRMVTENPRSSDATHPEGRQIRDNANLLIGTIEAQENLHRVWQAFSEVQPDKAQPILKDMVASGLNLSDARGMGTITELRKFAEEWRPGTDMREASEKALTELADGLLKNGQALDDQDVRDRIRAIGTSATDALQRVLRNNPPQIDRTNPDGKRLREWTEQLLDGIGKDVVEKLTDDAADARDRQRGEEANSISKLLSTIASDKNHPLAGSVLRNLNEEFHDWRPGTTRQQFAQNILQQVTNHLLLDGQGLADPVARSLLRNIGPAALPALKGILERNNVADQRLNSDSESMARAAREVIDAIEADEKERPVVVPKSRSTP